MRGGDALVVGATADENVAGKGDFAGVRVVDDVIGGDAEVLVGDDDLAVEGVDAGVVGLLAERFDADEIGCDGRRNRNGDGVLRGVRQAFEVGLDRRCRSRYLLAEKMRMTEE